MHRQQRTMTEQEEKRGKEQQIGFIEWMRHERLLLEFLGWKIIHTINKTYEAHIWLKPNGHAEQGVLFGWDILHKIWDGVNLWYEHSHGNVEVDNTYKATMSAMSTNTTDAFIALVKMVKFIKEQETTDNQNK